MSNKKSSKLIIRKSNITIFTMNIKHARNSGKGELDVFMDSPNKIIFDNVILGCFLRQYIKTVSCISWHGFYEIKNGVYQMPKIHFKTTQNHYIENLPHYGTINTNEPFAFPICSLYIPQNIPWLAAKVKTPYSLDGIIDYHFLDIPDDQDYRVDIFLTPKNIKVDDILNTSAGICYFGADIELFNLPRAPFYPLHEFAEMYTGKPKKALISEHLTINHDIILRTVKKQNRYFSRLEGTYSLLIHNPNNAFNHIANRLILYPNGDNHFIKEELLKLVP